MVPQTFPTNENKWFGTSEMVVFPLVSISGLQRWTDYIPVKTVTSIPASENKVDANGYIPVKTLTSSSGLSAFRDYVPVYVDGSATTAWSVSSVGYIPIGVSGGGSAQAAFSFLNVDSIDSRITFTSTSGGTYYNKWGESVTAATNAPRLNFDATTRQSKGLLITSAQSESALITDLSTIGGMGSAMTVYVEAYCPTMGTAAYPGLVSFNDSTVNNEFNIRVEDGATDLVSLLVINGGVVQANVPTITATAGQLIKVAASWSANSFRCACNGTAGTEDTSGTLPTVNRMQIGNGRGGANHFNAEIRKVVIYGSQASTATLQEMTR